MLSLEPRHFHLFLNPETNLADNVVKGLRPILSRENFVAQSNAAQREAKRKTPPWMFREERRRWRQRVSLALYLEFFRINRFSGLPDFYAILSRWKSGRWFLETEFAFALVRIRFGSCDKVSFLRA